jgi:Ca2+-binding EF-hand superfamily protein
VNLPGLIGERFFALASSPNKDRRVDFEFFQRLILDVYTKSHDEKARLALRLYDFNSDGKITPDDVGIILNHLPVTPDSNFSAQSDSSMSGHSYESH